LRFTSIMSTAFAMTAVVAHLLELPAKRRYEAELYVRLRPLVWSNAGKSSWSTQSEDACGKSS
jgi:hypothetical protein